MPRKNNLPNVILEPLDEPIEIVENIGDLVEESKKQHEDPFVQPEPEKPKVEPPLNYNNLTAKKLKEICKQSGYKNYSKLKKSDLIKMLNGEDIPEKTEKPKKSISIDTENEELIPKVKKSIERKPIKKQKKEELKDNLIKEEVLIKDDVEEVEEVEEILEEVERETKPIPPPTPKLKRREPILKPPQHILEPPKPILPPQPPKELYNPFKNYYTIY